MTPCGSRQGTTAPDGCRQVPGRVRLRGQRQLATRKTRTTEASRRGRKSAAPRSPHARGPVAPRSVLVDRPGAATTQIRPQLTDPRRRPAGPGTRPVAAHASARTPGTAPRVRAKPHIRRSQHPHPLPGPLPHPGQHVPARRAGQLPARQLPLDHVPVSVYREHDASARQPGGPSPLRLPDQEQAGGPRP